MPTDAALIAQASNSAGQSETEFSLKIWGWLLKPVTTEDLRNWTYAMNAALGPTARGKAALDFHQAVTVQPIYHHTPRFTGMADPMRGRRWRYLHRAGGKIELKKEKLLAELPQAVEPQLSAIRREIEARELLLARLNRPHAA